MKPRPALPPKLVIQLGRFVWTSLWHQMMAKLAPRSSTGAYLRPASTFRSPIGTGESPYPPASGRYRLYAGAGCPWAHRTLIVRSLKHLETAISLTLVFPDPLQGGWVLPEAEAGCQTLADLYQKAQPGYGGRATVPLLWDSQTGTIVNNESSEIIILLNQSFNAFAGQPELDLYPEALCSQIETWNEKIYAAVNNGVYRCGFAQTQAAYDQACQELFVALDLIEASLAKGPYLCGDTLTLADVRLFTTLFRFDLVYYGLFKCNRRRIRDYPYLSSYVRRIYQLPGVAATCDLEAIKRDYYGNLFPLNPGGIIPAGPDMDWLTRD